ncbi:hypothetical protein GQ43DRAFT_148351 [Delitschia confertaspora ATCC 74209]|uniref:Uncharacterized protein n=1 Tax=Delitschia confertaspora ATCC 74209 TaxID=1513339 RepID=A0A9P4JFY9_9PLEO|nr:hypothetical protein GQ43DRAFT_148351 [Delitschia confertaspora ATCC 74209]
MRYGKSMARSNDNELKSFTCEFRGITNADEISVPFTFVGSVSMMHLPNGIVALNFTTLHCCERPPGPPLRHSEGQWLCVLSTARFILPSTPSGGISSKGKSRVQAKFRNNSTCHSICEESTDMPPHAASHNHFPHQVLKLSQPGLRFLAPGTKYYISQINNQFHDSAIPCRGHGKVPFLIAVILKRARPPCTDVWNNPPRLLFRLRL